METAILASVVGGGCDASLDVGSAPAVGGLVRLWYYSLLPGPGCCLSSTDLRHRGYRAEGTAGSDLTSLRRLGKEVELAEYVGEDHWPGMWTEASYRDLYARIVRWFDQHLTPSHARWG
ncbi:MAG: hypothetical protein M1298_02260 [Chloroflexi bacterium]|nr:hypothetical protein [Chloroflexota bacterium]